MKRTLLKMLLMLATLFLSVESTIAYLTDSDADVNVMTLGRVEIDLIEQERNSADTLVDFQDNHPLYPGVHKNGLTIGTDGYWVDVRNAIDKIVTVKNTGKAPAYVRLWFAFEVTDNNQFFDKKIHLNRNTADWAWAFMMDDTGYQYLTLNGSRYVVATATYNQVLAPNAITPVSLRQVLLDSSATNNDYLKLGDKYSIFVVAQGMQTEGFDTAALALNEGFGAPVLAKHPFAGMSEEDTNVPDNPSSGVLYGETNRDGVPAMNTNSLTGNVVFTLPKGYEFKIVGVITDDDGYVEWYVVHCVHPDKGELYQVYIYADYVTAGIIPDNNEVEEDEIVAVGVIYNTDGVKFREGPGTQYAYNQILTPGTEVEIIEIPEVIDTQHWFKVRYNGTIGYIQAPYLYVKGMPDFVWEKIADGKGISITDYRGIDEVVEIPSEIEGLPVTEIGNHAFYKCTSPTRIIIPDSVTYIRDSAFYACTNLSSISIPDNVVHLGNNAFTYCPKLTSIEIPKSITTIGAETFYECYGLTDVVIPDGVVSIGRNAFFLCKSLENITIPDSVKTLGEGAFDSCSALENIHVGENNSEYSSVDGVVFSKDKTTLILYPDGRTGNYIVPNDVTYIGAEAFLECGGLTGVVMSDSVDTIGNRAFSNCSNLSNVFVPENVSAIHLNAFEYCNKLTITVVEGSYAQTWCQQNNVPFVVAE